MVSCFWLFVTTGTPASQTPLSMGFPSKNSGVDCHSYSWESSRFRDETHISSVSCIGRHILYHWTTWKPNIVIGMLNQWRGWQNHEQMKVLLTLPGADSVIGYMTDKTQDSGGSNSTAFQNLHHCKKWLHGEQSLELPFYRPRFICYFVKFRAKNIP